MFPRTIYSRMIAGPGHCNIALVAVIFLVYAAGPSGFGGSAFTLHNMGFGKRMQFVADSNRVWQEFTDCVNNINYVLPMVCRYQEGGSINGGGSSNPDNLKDLLAAEKNAIAGKDHGNYQASAGSASDIYGDDKDSLTKNILKRCCMENCDLDTLAKLCNT